MRTLLRLFVGVSLGCALSGCAGIVPGMTDAAYPVYGNPVNPTPAAGYRVECVSVPTFVYPLSRTFVSGCRQELAPTYERVVIRTNG